MAISTIELVKRRVQAHLHGDGATCAELDVAGNDLIHKAEYDRTMKELVSLSDDELKTWLSDQDYSYQCDNCGQGFHDRVDWSCHEAICGRGGWE